MDSAATAEVWVMNLLSAVEVIRDVLQGQLSWLGWSKGILEYTRTRMTLFRERETERQRKNSIKATTPRVQILPNQPEQPQQPQQSQQKPLQATERVKEAEEKARPMCGV